MGGRWERWEGVGGRCERWEGVGRGGREVGGHSSEYMFIIHGLPFTMLFLLGLCGME